jgi:dephospho-CoA kinase
MIVLGLTGSIGMGKSTAAAMFRALGVPVFDADAEVHRLQGPGGRLLEAIETHFPGSTTERGVDRGILGKMVLGNGEALSRLERLIHPAVGESRRAFLRRHRARRLVVLDIPLLFEKGGWRNVDATVVVSAPAWMQARRDLARKGASAARLKAIRKLQVPDREKRRRADFVIDTGVQRHRTAAQISALVACLRVHGVRYCAECGKLSSTRKRQA